MAAGITLHDLISAIAHAVIDAQDQIEHYQTRNIGRYFKNDKPRSVNIRVPSLRQGADKGDEDLIQVPWLSLVNATRLAIKDMEISMEVKLGELVSVDREGADDENSGDENAPSNTGPSAEWGKGKPWKAVMLDLRALRIGNAGPTANVTLRVESQESTEGMARLIQELNKRI